jgi:hypothetical protein
MLSQGIITMLGNGLHNKNGENMGCLMKGVHSVMGELKQIKISSLKSLIMAFLLLKYKEVL